MQKKQAEFERHLDGGAKKKKRVKAKPKQAPTDAAASPAGGSAPVRVKPKAPRTDTAAAYAAAATDMSPGTRTKEFGSL